MKLFKTLLLVLFFHDLSAQSDSLKLNLDEIVISSNKFIQLKASSPYQIEIIDKKNIAFQNTVNAAMLLEQSGNVFVQKSQAGGGSPILRGFEASRVLIVVDGVRMNNAIFRAGHLQNVLRIDQNILERVEVVFGPTSVMYGSDALGGTMHFRTKSPEYKTTFGNAYARYSSAFGEKTVHADFNLGSKKLASLTSITASKFDDLIMGKVFNSQYPFFGIRPNYVNRINNQDFIAINPFEYSQSPSGYNQVDFLEKISYTTKKLNHTLNFQGSFSTDVPRYDRLTDKLANNSLRFAEWSYGPESRLMAAYQLDLPETKYYDKGLIIASIQEINESRINRRFGNNNRKTQKEKVFVKALNADFQKTINDNVIQYGLEIIGNNVKSEAKSQDITKLESPGVPADTRYPDGKNTTTSMAFYLSDYYKFSEKLTLNIGARYNYANLNSSFIDKTFFPFPFDNIVQNNQAVTGSLGLVYFAKKNTRINLQGSSGFRTPNIDDLSKVFESSAGTLIVPNPSLKPEYSYNLEFGIRQNLSKNFRIEGTAYYSVLRNILVVDVFDLNGKTKVLYQGKESQVVALQNKNKGSIYGANLSINTKLSEDISLTGTFNYTKGLVSDSIPLDHIPPFFGKSSIKYNHGDLGLELFSIFNGAKKLKDYSPSGEDNLQYATVDGTPSWWTLNIRSSYMVHSKVQLQAAVENILDKNYRTFASGISAAGRNIILTLRVNF